MTTITLHYQITDHGITLSLDDNPHHTIKSGQYVVSTKTWPEPTVTLNVCPIKGTQAASQITLLVKGGVPETIPQNDVGAGSDYAFEKSAGVKLMITVHSIRRAQATTTIFAIPPGGTLELAKLPTPKTPASGQPQEGWGPGGINIPGEVGRIPGLSRIPKFEREESGIKHNVELDNLKKTPG